MADGVYVSIGGDSKKLQDASADAVKALRELARELDEMGKKAAGENSPGGGKKGLDQYRFSLDSLKNSLLENMGQFGAFMVVMDSTIGVVGAIAGVVGGAVSGFLQFAGVIGGEVVDAVRAAAGEIENLVQQVFELNKSTEQNTGSWKFIYGAAQTPDLMKWTSQFSMQVPYTRQDLMGAVTALGRAGLSEDQVKQYMSTIADMGALNPQRNLTQAAWSIQGAMHGYSRMLKYDYGIDEQDLAGFGYDPNNPTQTLLPALQAYLSARHMLGASKFAATETFWGAESSFVDRLQNFGLMVGGTDLSGNVSKGSLFGGLKDALTAVSAWWDDPQHANAIKEFANMLENVLGGAVKDVTSFFKGFADGIHASGFDSFLEWALRNLGDLLNSSGMQSGANTLGGLVGKGLGALLTDIGIGLSNLFNGIKGSGAGDSMMTGLKNVVDWLGDPQVRASIASIALTIGNFAVAIVGLGLALNGLGQAIQSVPPSFWQALGIAFVVIGAVFAAGFVAAFAGFVGLIVLLALPVIAVTAGIWLLIQGLQSLGDALKGIHWPTFGPSQPGDPGAPEVPGGSGATTSTGGGPMVAFGPVTRQVTAALLSAQRSGGLSGGGYGAGGSGSALSYATNSYGGHSTVSQTFHGVGEVEMERVAKRVMAENDLAQNILSRRIGGYRPGSFGSIG